MAKAIQFLRECKAELKKVVWPTREDVVSSVTIVVISSVIIAVLLGAFDLAFTGLFRLLMK